MRVLPEEYIHRLIDFLADWGVRGLCISGGGEPTLHPAIEWIISHALGKMDVALVICFAERKSRLYSCI